MPDSTCHILTELGDSITTEDGQFLVGENCATGFIAGPSSLEGYLLRPMQGVMMQLNGF